MDKEFNFDTDFGGLIREERAAQSISMRELGRRVGIPEQTLSHYERGTRKITQSTAELLAEGLDTTVNGLLDKYGKYSGFVPSWFSGDIDAWEEFLHSPLPQIYGNTSAFDKLLEELGYKLKPYRKGGCTIIFPDGQSVNTNAADKEAVEIKATDYVNMLLTQLRYDSKRRSRVKEFRKVKHVTPE